jgi:hypothetical protein
VLSFIGGGNQSTCFEHQFNTMHIFNFADFIENEVDYGWYFSCVLFIYKRHNRCFISFIGGGNQSTLRKPPAYRYSLANFIT